MARPRPWRAVAYTRNPWGRLEVAGRVAGVTWPGIRGWVRARQAAGQAVQVWEVLPLPGTGGVRRYCDLDQLS